MDNMTHKAKHEQFITVVLCEPGKEACVTTIPNNLKTLQNTVGGYIEAIYPFDDPVAIICNEEGKLNSMELNRALRDESGQIYDILAGPFFVTGLGDEDFTSLSEELQQKYYNMFKRPELFLWDGNRIRVISL